MVDIARALNREAICKWIGETFFHSINYNVQTLPNTLALN